MNSTNTTTPYVFNDTHITFMFINSCLVLFMTPGLSLFYAGMVKSKNSASTIAQSFISHVIVSVVWWFWGFSLAFSTGGPLFGNLDYIMLLDFKMDLLGTPHVLTPTIPILLFCMYQCMFASITPALISGALAERARFRTYCLFCALWLTIVYCPVAHSIWHPEGWLFKLGCLDFAGGLVVHLTSGTAALVFAVVLKRRKGYFNVIDIFWKCLVPASSKSIETEEEANLIKGDTMWEKIKKFPSPAGDFKSHSLPLLCIGTGILWVGWFGFNGGSSLTPNGQSVIGLVNTNFAGSAGKSPIVGICNGAICGLAAVTPAAGYLYPSYAVLCGVTSAFVSYLFIKVKVWFMDDSLDVVGIHMVQGVYGTLFAGIFASKSIAAHAGVTIGGGWIDGNFIQLPIQLAGVGFVFIWSLVMTLILYYILDLLPLFGWRITEYEERIGLDQSQHGEDSYIFEDLEDLNYSNQAEKCEEDFKPLTKVLFRSYLVPEEKRPGKKIFGRRPKDMEKKESVVVPGKDLKTQHSEIHSTIIVPPLNQEMEVKVIHQNDFSTPQKDFHSEEMESHQDGNSSSKFL